MNNGPYRESLHDPPNLNELREDWQWAVQQRDHGVFRRQRRNFETRHCVWPNQSDDGKRWTAPAGQTPFPWPGASDARVPLVDLYINQDVAFLMVVWDRMRLVASGVEVNDTAQGHRLTSVLRWMKTTQMQEARREMKLAANYLLERGSAVISVLWDRGLEMGYTPLDMETLRAHAMTLEQQGGEGMTPEDQTLAQLPGLILDPTAEAQAVETLAALYEGASRARLRQAVRELRSQGATRLPAPNVTRNRPTIVALAPNEDIFIPPETSDPQQARSWHRRELLSESRLRERKWTHGWDEAFITRMIETQRGAMTDDFAGQVYRGGTRVNSYGQSGTEKLFEVVHSYQRLHNEDGVPGIYYTCWNPRMMELPAHFSPLDYDHGEYPFVFIERETRCRLLDESRGYGEVAHTMQQQVKTQWDARIDRASLATLPPSYYPVGHPPDKWGPGVKLGTVRNDDYGFLQIPPYDIGSKEVEDSVRRFSDEYFGRPVDEYSRTRAMTQQQELANTWMAALRQVDTQTLKLMQQYMPEEFFYRVVGTNQAKPLRATRDEIQGQFDITLTYNVSDLDNEIITAKLGLVEKALLMDTTGRVDRNAALDMVFELIDPNMGERLLRPAADASQSEIDDEQTTFAKLFAGVDVDVKPGSGQAYDLRLQVLQNIFARNPAAQKRFEEDEHFRKLVEKRVQQLQHQLQQRENAMIGRLGA